MKLQLFIPILAGTIALSAIGTTTLAMAQSSKKPEQIVAQDTRMSPSELKRWQKIAIKRTCNPDSFEQTRKTDFKGISLTKKQTEKIQEEHQTFVKKVAEYLQSNKCLVEGVIAEPILVYSGNYEAVVREILTPQQQQKWDENIDAILRGR